MSTFTHPILKEVAALGLPCPEDVVINHGAALVIRGVRAEHEPGDIDASVSPENIQYLHQVSGWFEAEKTVGIDANGQVVSVPVLHDAARRFDIHQWDFSIPQYEATGHGRISLDEQKLRAEQDQVTGIWVATLEYVRETKQGTGRAQDEDDIALIDKQTPK